LFDIGVFILFIIIDQLLRSKPGKRSNVGTQRFSLQFVQELTPSDRRSTIEAMEHFTYTAYVEPAEEVGYSVTVPSLPGCFSYGESFEAAVANAEEAVLAHIETLHKHGEPIPREPEPHTPVAIGVRIPITA
jgi:antitoxin HicB